MVIVVVFSGFMHSSLVFWISWTQQLSEFSSQFLFLHAQYFWIFILLSNFLLTAKVVSPYIYKGIFYFRNFLFHAALYKHMEGLTNDVERSNEMVTYNINNDQFHFVVRLNLKCLETGTAICEQIFSQYLIYFRRRCTFSNLLLNYII